MGGPQLPENAPAKKRGELYGNRIQGLGRPIGTPPSRSCSPILPTDDSPSPSPRKRCVSTGGALLNGTPPRLTIHEPAPPLPPTPSLPSARRNSLAVDFGPAKRVINSDEISRHAVEDCESFPPSPSLSPSLRVGATFDIVSSSQSSLEPVTPKDSLPQDVEVLSPAEKEPEAPELVLQDGSNLAPAIALDMMTTSQFSPEIIPVFEVTSTVEPDQDNSPTSEGLSERLQYPALSVDASPSDSQPPEAALPVTTTSQCSLRAIPIVEAPPTDQTDSPISDELSQASHHPVLPVDTSMSDAPPSAAMLHVTAITQSPLRIVPVVEASFAVEPDQASDPGSDELSQTSHHPALSADTPISDVQPPEAALPGSPSKASSFARTSSLDAPTEDDSALSHSLVSIIDASESTAAANKEHDNVDEVPSTSEFPNTEERGTISINVPHPKIQVQPSPPSPDMNTEIIKAEVKRSFTAVVHRKVTEMPAAKAPTSTLSAFMTPQIARVQRMGITISAEPAPSPSYGELATLLEEAALLEMRLTEGDIVTPSESLQVVPSKTPTNSTFPTDVRSASSSTLTEHVKAPSTDSASISGRSVSIPSIREPNMGGNIPEEDEVDGRSLASTSASQRSPSHKKYLSSIRRLTSRRSSNYMPGAYPRDSISTCSEDSAAIATPSDHGDGSGEGFGIAWPSVSPKKGSMGRSSSFADKLFNRNRTKSNVSAVETGV